MSRFRNIILRLIDIKFLIFNSFALQLFLVVKATFLFRTTKSNFVFHFPVKRQYLNENCVSICPKSQSQLMGLPVAQNNLQEIEHLTL